MRKSTGSYPPNWNQISIEVKDSSFWRCVRCGHPHDTPAGFMLTVHHLDMNKSNCAWWNIPALCQKCHLHIQHKVDMYRVWMFEHTPWFKPYVAGAYAARLGIIPATFDYYESLKYYDQVIVCQEEYIRRGISEFIGVTFQNIRSRS